MSHFVLIQKGEKFPFLPKGKKFETPEAALDALTPSTVKITEVYANGTADLSPMNLKAMVDQRAEAIKADRAAKLKRLESRRVILDTPKKKSVKKVVAKKKTAAKKRK